MSQNNKKPSRIPFEKVTWVINNLTQKDLDIVDDMDVGLEHIQAFFDEQIDCGGQFSFKHDYYSDCPQLSLMFLETGNHHTGYALSARGADFTHCAKIIMYKFYEVAQGDLTALSDNRQNRPKYG